jgi:1-acyl-sn-glycerol-3-phosphate acyltransferase
MMNLLIVCSVLLVFAWYDIMLHLGRVFDRRGSIAYSEFLVDRALGRVISLLRSYRGFKVEVDDRLEGRFPPRFVLVANHQSMVDILMLIVCLRGKKLRFVAKRELGSGVPLVSQVLRFQGHSLVARRVDPGQSMRSLDRFARRCRRDGSCPVIFPEGTRSHDGELLHFHSGGLRRVLAVEPLPLVVVAMDGGWRIAKIKDILHNLEGARYQIRIAAVLPAPTTKQECAAAVEQSKEIIASALKEMRG